MRAHLQGRAQGSAAVSCAVVTSRQGADSFGLDQGCWEAIAYPFLRTFAAARLTELAEARVSFSSWEIEEAKLSIDLLTSVCACGLRKKGVWGCLRTHIRYTQVIKQSFIKYP